MSDFPNIQISMAAGEPEAPRPEEASPPAELRTCPDCGTQGTGAYCSNCGETLEPALPPVMHYIKELLNDIAAFDSKLIRTVPALLFRPGFLTKEYIAGRRKRYLVPSRLYLLTGLIVFFALGSYLHKAFLTATSKPALSAALAAAANRSPADSSKPASTTIKLSSPTIDYSFRNMKGEEVRLAVDKFIGLAVEVSPYVILLGSTPLFALILWLLYRKKSPFYVEHLIFSFHFFAFALIVLVAGIVLNSNIALVVGFTLFLVYLFIAMRRVYSDRGMGLVLRFATVSASYFMLATFAIVISVTVAGLWGAYSGDFKDIRNRTPSNVVGRDTEFNFKFNK